MCFSGLQEQGHDRLTAPVFVSDISWSPCYRVLVLQSAVVAVSDVEPLNDKH